MKLLENINRKNAYNGGNASVVERYQGGNDSSCSQLLPITFIT